MNYQQIPHQDLYSLEIETLEEQFLKLFDLEQLRKEQAKKSINIKAINRVKNNQIKSFKRSLQQKRDIIKKQLSQIGEIMGIFLMYLEQIEIQQKCFEHTENYFNKKAEPKEEKQQVIQQDKNQTTFSIRDFIRPQYRNINDVLSDNSFSSQDNEKKVKINKGPWTKREREIYYQFAEENRYILDNEELRYKEKIFVQLSNLIKTRNTDQCRKFHNVCTRKLL